MTPDEIRNTFGHNSVYGQEPDQVLRLQVLAMGELAAQLAEARQKHIIEVDEKVEKVETELATLRRMLEGEIAEARHKLAHCRAHHMEAGD